MPPTSLPHSPELPRLELPAGHASFRGRGVCVTGGAGFIGSHLVGELLARGARVSAIDDLSNGSRGNLPTNAPLLRFIEASILDDTALDAALTGVEIVFHEAALASVPESIKEPERYASVNALGTLRVLEAARRRGVRRVIYAGSSSAYGDLKASPKVESMPTDPLSPYAASKLAGEHFLRAACHSSGLEGAALRYFNVYGPRQRADSAYAAVIPRFIDAIRRGEPPVIFGSGEQTRDFVHVGDVVWANLLAGSSPRVLRGECVNIASERVVSLLELVRLLGRLSGKEVAARHEPARAGDIVHSAASIAAARELIGYGPRVSLEDGLGELVRG